MEPRQRKAAPFVDLASLGDDDYLRRLGANTRQQIRRSRRLYGEVSTEIADGAEAAARIWRELEALHQVTWRRRGKPGAFARDFFRAFHERLITERLQRGEIQLLRVAAEGGTIGCLYNFVYRGRVYAYQSGLAYGTDNRLKPGLVAHHEAIEASRRAGRRIYDFLAGGDRYKRSLATGSLNLVWGTAGRSPPLALKSKTKRISRHWNERGK